MRFWWHRAHEDHYKVWANDLWRQQAEARLRALAEPEELERYRLVAAQEREAMAAIAEAEAIVRGARA